MGFRLVGAPEVVNDGDMVVLVAIRGGSVRHYYVKVRAYNVYSTVAGVVRGADVIGRGYGECLEVADGEICVLKPTLRELLENFYERVTQVIYPKDAGVISFELGLRRGMRVLEGGTGSGFMTSELARIVCPTGRVYSYDVREDNLRVAERNLRMSGLIECVELKLGDVRRGVEEGDLDAAVLDIPDPWEALEPLSKSIKPSAPLVAFIPTMNQVVRLVGSVARSRSWILSRIVEVSEREVDFTEEAVRPSRTTTFTGYIAVLRRVIRV
jgi:tRNA (adenine57-N1/adenine58-N1)-methyltransferase